MSIAGVDDDVAGPLVRAVSAPGAAAAPDEAAERFARAAWSHLAEPGDALSGLLVQVFGAPGALERLVRLGDDEKRAARELSAELTEATGDSPGVELLREAVLRWRPRRFSHQVIRALSQAQRFGVQLVVPSDPEWPTLLGDLGAHAPHALWLRGRREALHVLENSIAIVGARAATGYGEHVAVELASGLADRGFAIVSGAAYGIDGIAHRSALASAGDTIAVLAGGLDRFYPSGHEALLTRVIERGAAIAEVPCGTAPTRWRFLQRNRLIAAATRATVVVEAGWRSGSLNTAHHALALGRPVGVVPGPVTSSASAGCHRLLREAPVVCVTNPGEAAELVADESTGAARGAPGAPSSSAAAEAAPESSGVAARVLDALSERSPRTIDNVAAAAGLAVDEVRATLGLLDLDGWVRERPTGWLKAAANRREVARAD